MGWNRVEASPRRKTVREMLSGVKFGLDFYQREYSWTTKQVEELLSDLSGKFLSERPKS